MNLLLFSLQFISRLSEGIIPWGKGEIPGLKIAIKVFICYCNIIRSFWRWLLMLINGNDREIIEKGSRALIKELGFNGFLRFIRQVERVII